MAIWRKPLQFINVMRANRSPMSVAERGPGRMTYAKKKIKPFEEHDLRVTLEYAGKKTLSAQELRVTLQRAGKYSQLSANGHSRKRTALLTDAFSNPRFTSQSNSVFTQSRKRTLSRKRTRTLLKMKIGFFFCLRSLVSGHAMYNN